MFITLRHHYKIVERYEKRIDDLLNRLMSNNFSEYKFTKEAKPTTLEEPISRSDEDEYKIEQDRLNDLKELEAQAGNLKAQMTV